jgi:FKBP-type peptidyl-prolyl cis-trans isomerase SlpA
MKKIKNGDTVKVHYTGRLEDGDVFDTSMVDGREPITVTLGENSLIVGFENGLIDMAVGEKKTIEIKCSEAYGEYNDGMIQEVPKSQMPGEVEIGMSLQSQTDMGVIQFLVKEIKEESVILDANHKLAGKDLIFDLEVLEIQ